MSYLVMARKWRPKNFEEMVGQEHIAQTIRNALSSGRIAHAFLFTGTRGVGKTTSARILAKALNCKQGPTATPCENCENCVAVNTGSSMDVLEIDGASNNGVDNVRELREQVKYAPMHGAYKVYIIDEVHMLSKAAFNALLKTLEEPPPHVVFVFATTEVGKVPHTILSRVQRFDFKRISEAAIRERLEFISGKEGVKPEREALETIARKADGSMRDALSLFDRVYAFSGADLTLDAARKVLGIPEDRLYDDLLRHIAGHNAAGCFGTLEEMYGQGLELSEFLLGFGEYLRDLLFGRQEGITPAMLSLGETRFKELRKLGGDLQDGDLIRYARIVSELLAGLRNAPHPRLWVELGLARLAALDRVVSLSQLLGSTEGGHVAAPSHPVAAPDPAAGEEPKKKSPEPSPFPVTPSPLPFSRGETDAKDEAPGGPAKTETETGTASDTEEPDIEAVVRALADSDPLTLENLSYRWDALIEAYALEKPLTASPLLQARPRVKPGEPPCIELLFANAHQHDLFLTGARNKRDLNAFLRSQLGPECPFVLEFAVDPAPPIPEPSGLKETEKAEGPAQDDPAVKNLLDLFDGRILDTLV